MVVHPYNSESNSYIHIGKGDSCNNDDDDDIYHGDNYHYHLLL